MSRERSFNGTTTATILKLYKACASGLSERIMTQRVLLTKNRLHALVDVYKPTLKYSDESKEAFYHELLEVLHRIASDKKHLVLGDLHAKVGMDFFTYDGTIGKYGRR